MGVDNFEANVFTFWSIQPSGSPYHTIQPVDSQSSQWNLAVQWKQLRSNSWSDSLDDCRVVPVLDLNRWENAHFLCSQSSFLSRCKHLHCRSLLNDTHRQLYDTYKRVYAEMLFRWNLLVPRAKVLKYLSVNTEVYRDVEFVTECTSCARVTRAPLCKECRKALLNCTLCRLPVKGLSVACLNCGHGGHTEHMRQWFTVLSFYFTTNLMVMASINLSTNEMMYSLLLFQSNEECAYGCGCHCLQHIWSDIVSCLYRVKYNSVAL